MNQPPPVDLAPPAGSLLETPVIAGVSRNVLALGITSFFADISGK